ncbi:MAG TPA: type II secretion system protein [Candidatus Faecicola pullistercoris]|nr:type II secretion system protein [Candidatus Faecicola pullistercoris]
MKLLKSKKGFTLIELTIVIAIMGILALTTTLLMTSSTDMYSKGRQLINSTEIANIVLKNVEAEVRKCENITIIGAGGARPSANTIYASALGSGTYAEKVVLKKGDAEYFGIADDDASIFALYGNYDISLSFKAQKSDNTSDIFDILIITVNVGGNEVSAAPLLLNLSRENGIVKGAGASEAGNTISGTKLEIY